MKATTARDWCYKTLAPKSPLELGGEWYPLPFFAHVAQEPADIAASLCRWFDWGGVELHVLIMGPGDDDVSRFAYTTETRRVTTPVVLDGSARIPALRVQKRANVVGRRFGALVAVRAHRRLKAGITWVCYCVNCGRLQDRLITKLRSERPEHRRCKWCKLAVARRGIVHCVAPVGHEIDAFVKGHRDHQEGRKR